MGESYNEGKLVKIFCPQIVLLYVADQNVAQKPVGTVSREVVNGEYNPDL